jgi:hypothetical protein
MILDSPTFSLLSEPAKLKSMPLPKFLVGQRVYRPWIPNCKSEEKLYGQKATDNGIVIGFAAIEIVHLGGYRTLGWKNLVLFDDFARDRLYPNEIAYDDPARIEACYEDDLEAIVPSID